MELLEEIFIHSYVGALIWMVIGVFSFYSFKRKTKKEKEDLHLGSQKELQNVRSVWFGISSIILGILIIVFKLLGKL